MNTARFKSQTRADAPLVEPGYLKAWISLLTDFDTLNEPVLSTTPVIGEAYTIGTSHVWTDGKEAVSILVDKDTLEVTGESAGAKGSQRLTYAPKIFIKGDGPKVLEMVNNWLNEEMIIFVQDQCNPAKYIQFGCDCSPAEISKAGFQSGTLKGSNAKGYEMTFEVRCKYFYNGAISEL